MYTVVIRSLDTSIMVMHDMLFFQILYIQKHKLGTKV